MQAVTVSREGDLWIGRFTAMASPCELLVAGGSRRGAEAVFAAAREEALRIERKFSRYRDDNIVAAINTAAGATLTVDAETARLLDYSQVLYELSGGLFDITSGVLRRAWRFDGSDRLPEAAQVQALLAHVGWQRVRWQPPAITLPDGMEIDLGGIGKEYAVDRVVAMCRDLTRQSCLVNFGGDLSLSRPREDGKPWRVGIESIDGAGADALLDLFEGALATSGDSRRFLLREGKRYSHVLDPRSGWPVANAPRSVTVLAPTCSQAGMLATLAQLQGSVAGEWLAGQGIRHWLLN